MTAKKKRRILQLIGFILGLLYGYFRPSSMQSLLPVLGIGVGISYFLFSSRISDENKSLDDSFMFPLVQMFMYFLIGGALTSTVLLALEMRP